jgi:hypothetical protein
MAMINAQRLLRPLAAYRAHAALGRQQRVVICRRYAVKAFELTATKERLNVLLVGMVIGATARVDLLLVGFVVGVASRFIPCPTVLVL